MACRRVDLPGPRDSQRIRQVAIIMMMTLGLGMRNKLRSVGQGLRNAPTASRNGRFVLFLAVIPWYRQECVDLLKDRLGADLSIYGSAYGLDGTVRTGIHLSLIHI